VHTERAVHLAKLTEGHAPDDDASSTRGVTDSSGTQEVGAALSIRCCREAPWRLHWAVAWRGRLRAGASRLWRLANES
jgi:hypothetical protein